MAIVAAAKMNRESFVDQYGTLRRAVEIYLDGRMPVEQQAQLERVVEPAFIAAVSQNRLFQALVVPA